MGGVVSTVVGVVAIVVASIWLFVGLFGVGPGLVVGLARRRGLEADG